MVDTPTPADIASKIAPLPNPLDVPDEADDTDDTTDTPLAPAGQKALDRMKAERNDLRAQLRTEKKAREDETAKTDAEKKAREVERELLAKANRRIVSAEIRLAAKGILADPDDAHLYIDPTKFDVDDNGNVDEEAIADAVRDLVTKKPHLAASATTRTMTPDASQGAPGAAKTTASDPLLAALTSAVGGRASR